MKAGTVKNKNKAPAGVSLVAGEASIHIRG
jgi:hypothetical protein